MRSLDRGVLDGAAALTIGRDRLDEPATATDEVGLPAVDTLTPEDAKATDPQPSSRGRYVTSLWEWSSGPTG